MAADIKQKIAGKYNIDIDEKNIFKLYKIKSADISDADLRKILDSKRNDWTQIINTGANETQIKKAKQNLSHADGYEKILSDKKLRTQLFNYYQDSEDDANTTASARKFFEFVSLSAKVNKECVEFYFRYFKEERVHKNAITKLLRERYKLSVSDADNEADNASDGKVASNTSDKKRRSSILVNNSFSKETILKVNQCVRYYDEAVKSQTVLDKFPGMEESLYHFLHLQNYHYPEQFQEYVNQQKDKIANIRYEFGQEFSPLVDLFNMMYEVIQSDDVKNNFEEFHLLIRYDRLSPYMSCMENVNKAVIDALYRIAAEQYDFEEMSDFLNLYFIPVYSHFNLYIANKKLIIRKAIEKKNRLKPESEIKLKGTQTVLFVLAYWPILLFYLLQRFLKILVNNLKYFSYLISALVFYVLIMIGPDMYRLDYRILKDLGEPEWTEAIEKIYQNMIQKTMVIDNNRSLFMFSALTILILVVMYIAPVILTQYFMVISMSKIIKTIDTATIDRTVQAFIERGQDAVVDHVNRKQIYKIVFSGVFNIAMVIVPIVLLTYC